tara:strand:- start:26 stop:154 length:129 start_codon:yes stop_codon:yes gene_type:complete
MRTNKNPQIEWSFKRTNREEILGDPPFSNVATYTGEESPLDC